MAFLTVGLFGCQPTEPAAPSVAIDPVRADLEVISSARVFFGHQSVGRDLLVAIRDLSKEAGIDLPIIELKPGEHPAGQGLFHSNVGHNGDPASKLAAFMAEAASLSQSFDLALLKFCYVDLGDGSKEKSPENIFKHYQRDVTRLQSEHPNMTLLHATMPLMSDPPGWKTTVKRWLGRPIGRDVEHRRRAAYNEQVRASFAPDRVFDIARLESTRLTGEQSAFSIDGKTIETMAMEFTHDGGHLNEPANRRIAAAFLHSVAEELRRAKPR